MSVTPMFVTRNLNCNRNELTFNRCKFIILVRNKFLINKEFNLKYTINVKPVN